MKPNKSLFVIGSLFFVFGFITWLNATLVPFLKIACELNNFESYFVTFAFYIAYFIFAIPSSFVLKKVGFKQGMALGLWIMSVGALVFIPAAYTRSYGIFLTGLFMLGAGLALLQTAANPYAAIIGPIETAARRISIMGICSKVAGTVAPLILGSVVLSQMQVTKDLLPSMDEEQMSVMLDGLARLCVPPYIAIAATLFLLAIVIRHTHLPEVDFSKEEAAQDTELSTKRYIIQYPHLIFGVIAMFFYVGAEVISIDSLIGYATAQGISATDAKSFPMYSMLALIVGYLVGIVSIPRIMNQRMVLVFSAILGLVFTLSAIVTSAYTSLTFLVFLGFANAMIWPTIWGLALEGLGRHTSFGSSLLIMAIAGGAILPLVYGAFADYLPTLFNNMEDGVNLRLAYLVLLPCYLVILFYAMSVKAKENKESSSNDNPTK
ncbi:MAG: sugar MFS transporter [Bacteroidales bacterium]